MASVYNETSGRSYGRALIEVWLPEAVRGDGV
jgi:hypothetical protein